VDTAVLILGFGTEQLSRVPTFRPICRATDSGYDGRNTVPSPKRLRGAKTQKKTRNLTTTAAYQDMQVDYSLRLKKICTDYSPHINKPAQCSTNDCLHLNKPAQCSSTRYSLHLNKPHSAAQTSLHFNKAAQCSTD